MAIIKKKLSFVMQLDGITINSMNDLRENPSSELLQMYKDGRLGRWLGSHHADEERKKLNELTLTGDTVNDLAAIFKILGIDRDIDDIRSGLFAETGNLVNSKSAEEVNSRLNLTYFIQSLYWMKNELSEDINYIDRDYISLKITTKEYLNKVQQNKELDDNDVDNSFFAVNQISKGNLRFTTYINKVIRCIFGTEHNLKSGEKHIDSPSWANENELKTIINNNVERRTFGIMSSFAPRAMGKPIVLHSLWINDIHFPLKRNFAPDAVLIILQQICDLCGDVKITFAQKDS